VSTATRKLSTCVVAVVLGIAAGQLLAKGEVDIGYTVIVGLLAGVFAWAVAGGVGRWRADRRSSE